MRSTHLPGRPSAVDDDVATSDVRRRRRGEEEDGRLDVVGDAHPAHHLAAVSRAASRPSCCVAGFGKGPGVSELTRMPAGPSRQGVPGELVAGAWRPPQVRRRCAPRDVYKTGVGRDDSVHRWLTFMTLGPAARGKAPVEPVARLAFMPTAAATTASSNASR